MSAALDFILGDLIWLILFWCLAFPFIMIAILIYMVKMNGKLARLIQVQSKAPEPPTASKVELTEAQKVELK